MTIILCDDGRHPPREGAECPAAVYSKGFSCKNCEREDCYRQGWSARLVTLDNAGRYAERKRKYLEEKRRGQVPKASNTRRR